MGGFAPLFSIIAFWFIRFKYDPQGVKNELEWILACALLWYGHSLISVLTYVWKTPFALVLCATLLFCPSLLSCGYFTPRSSNPGAKKVAGARTETARPPLSEILKPLVFPCRTSHTRIFPKKHSFSYSYLFIGIPIGWRGSLGSFLSVDTTTSSQKTWFSWFSVVNTDYLKRGSHALGLKGKLDEYLKSQNEDFKAYAYAYLITAPRFLGYSFNPVSFWYLYNAEKELKAMILEVNNTFDERHIYFLKNTGDVDPISAPGSPNGKLEGELDESKSAAMSGSTRIQSSAKLNSRWTKDFHVSPFNSRKGSYALSAQDPFYPQMAGNGSVHNLVTLFSSKDHVKLIARVFSTGDSIDPFSLNSLERLRLIASWWWVGFMTFPRIVKEAGKLFFRKKLHVWYRPEVLKDSIGRQETNDERIIEQCFRNYLRFQVENSDLDKPLKYTSATASDPTEEIFYPKGLQNSTTFVNHIILKITTPLFYAVLARASDPTTVFLYSSLQMSNPYPQTLYTSHPDLLSSLFSPDQSSLAASLAASAQHLSLTRLRWSLLDHLRKGQHPLDQHALCLPPPLSRQYRAVVFKLLFSEIFLFRLPVLADLLCLAMKVYLFYSYIKAISAAVAGLWMEHPAGTASISWFEALNGVGLHLWWLLGETL